MPSLKFPLKHVVKEPIHKDHLPSTVFIYKFHCSCSKECQDAIYEISFKLDWTGKTNKVTQNSLNAVPILHLSLSTIRAIRGL